MGVFSPSGLFINIPCFISSLGELCLEITSFLLLLQFQDIGLNITPSVASGKLRTSLAIDR